MHAVKRRMPSGESFAFKKVIHVAPKRFTVQNRTYMQMLIDYLHSKDPYTLK